MKAKQKMPSMAQAKLLARLWGGNNQARVGSGYENSTVRVCIKHGWLEPTKNTGTFPNGSAWTDYCISTSGIDAIEDYLRIQYWERK